MDNKNDKQIASDFKKDFLTLYNKKNSGNDLGDKNSNINNEQNLVIYQDQIHSRETSNNDKTSTLENSSMNKNHGKNDDKNKSKESNDRKEIINFNCSDKNCEACLEYNDRSSLPTHKINQEIEIKIENEIKKQLCCGDERNKCLIF